MNSPQTNLNEEQIGKTILDSAFKVHPVLGPGLLESAYESALAIELSKNGLEGKSFFNAVPEVSQLDFRKTSPSSRASRDT